MESGVNNLHQLSDDFFNQLELFIHNSSNETAKLRQDTPKAHVAVPQDILQMKCDEIRRMIDEVHALQSNFDTDGSLSDLIHFAQKVYLANEDMIHNITTALKSRGYATHNISNPPLPSLQSNSTQNIYTPPPLVPRSPTQGNEQQPNTHIHTETTHTLNEQILHTNISFEDLGLSEETLALLKDESN